MKDDGETQLWANKIRVLNRVPRYHIITPHAELLFLSELVSSWIVKDLHPYIMLIGTFLIS